ncbi:MAG TPA: response regulator [Deltaproteobacteria bacterium]|nr:response regulator [Deltaproteobacteria bacterium]
MTDRAILIVDDEAQIRNAFKMAFEQVGYSTYLAESGEEALDVLKTNNIHVMYLDLRLPGMNGLDLCRQIRKDQPISIIYAVTGYASIFELRDCREAGFDDYFAKPVELGVLCRTAEEAFEKLARWKRK